MDDNETIGRLKALKKKAQQWLDCAKQRGIKGPINWADLHVTAAERVLDDEGAESFRVTISEAAPEAADLRRYIRECLEASGHYNIEVVTEW
jgi:hypothetical protein